MATTRIYPLTGLANQRGLWAWISYDVANQSFTLLINTLLFSIFFTKVVLGGAEDAGTRWAMTYAASMLVTVLVSPLAGAIADAKAWKKAGLLVSGGVCAACTCGLAMIEPGQFWLAVALYVPANFAFSIGENFLASFLPELTDRKNFGRVSGFSWAMAYSAALVLLMLTAGAMQVFGLKDPVQWRWFFLFAGVWFFAFMLPTAVFLKEQPTARGGEKVNVWTVGFVRLGQSIRNSRRHVDLLVLLGASLFYGTGMSVVIFFASLLAEEFGFADTQLVLFIAVITVSGVVGTLVPTVLQDRIGHKRTTMLLVVMWVVTTLLMALYAFMRSRAAAPEQFPNWPLWALGNLLGFGLGSLGSANRAFVGYLSPTSRTAEVFGLWGMVFKLAAVLTIPFAMARDMWGTPTSLLVLAGFLIAGLIGTMLIDEKRGVEAARRADEEAGIG
jgi:MFS transporter, UMF1 family